MATLRIFGLVLNGMVWYGLVLNGMVHEYCLDVVPWKILSSWYKKHWVMASLRIFGLEWYGMLWFGYEWYGAWELSRYSSFQNFELLALKTSVLLPI